MVILRLENLLKRTAMRSFAPDTPAGGQGGSEEAGDRGYPSRHVPVKEQTPWSGTANIKYDEANPQWRDKLEDAAERARRHQNDW